MLAPSSSRPLTRRVGLAPCVRAVCSRRGQRCAAGAANSRQQAVTQVQDKELESALEAAIAQEDYAKAAELRDRIASDPARRIQAALEAAVRAEEWQTAAKLRDELAELRPPPPPARPRVPCHSEAVTNGVRCTVRSEALAEGSGAPAGTHAFAYFVELTNEGSVAVKLLGRHWVITDANGRVEHVRGSGVVGQQPLLKPGESFTYNSFCPLQTSCGTMSGEFMFAAATPGAEGRLERFTVRVARFGLDSANGEVPLPPGAQDP